MRVEAASALCLLADPDTGSARVCQEGASRIGKEINADVVLPSAKSHDYPGLLQDRRPGKVKSDDLIETGMVFQQGDGLLVAEISDMGPGEALAQRAKKRRGEHDVARVPHP